MSVFAYGDDGCSHCRECAACGGQLGPERDDALAELRAARKVVEAARQPEHSCVGYWPTRCGTCDGCRIPALIAAYDALTGERAGKA